MATQKTSGPRFPIALAWAAVAAADRINLQNYYNATAYGMPQDARFNKAVAMNALVDSSLLTDEDFTFGIEMSAHFSGLLMQKIGGNIKSGFIDTIANIVGMDTVGKFEVACMAALPKTYRSDMKRENSVNKQQSYIASSNYISQEGSKILTKLTIIDSIYSSNYNIYINTATDGVNIFKFSTAHDARVFPLNQEITVKAKVKRHAVNDRTGVKETWINYIKRI